MCCGLWQEFLKWRIQHLTNFHSDTQANALTASLSSEISAAKIMNQVISWFVPSPHWTTENFPLESFIFPIHIIISTNESNLIYNLYIDNTSALAKEEKNN